MKRSLVDYDSSEEEETVNSKSMQRIRSQPHIAGHYASHVHVILTLSKSEQNLLSDALSLTPALIAMNNPLVELHLSLSRTLYVHHIYRHAFLEALQSSTRILSSATLRFSPLRARCLTNEEKTCSFVALDLIQGSEQVQRWLDCVDQVLKRFSLPLFYQPPLFHCSFAWMASECIPKSIFARLENFLSKATMQSSWCYDIRQLHCRIGQNIHVLPLLDS